MSYSNDNYGFIITRHVNSENTNKYWNHCVRCITRFYPFKKIIVIDDNSNQEFVKAEAEYQGVEIIQSEYPGRGELLPYYYFFKKHFFNNAIIIHDSVFFHKRINFEKIIGIPVMPLWHFNPDKENVQNSYRIINHLKNTNNLHKSINMSDELVLGMNKKKKWYGCFGVQSVINYNFLNFLNRRHNIFNMLNAVTCKTDRCCLERIMGLLFHTHFNKLNNNCSLFGNIITYTKWGCSFDEYQQKIQECKIDRPVVKVWTGR